MFILRKTKISFLFALVLAVCSIGALSMMTVLIVKKANMLDAQLALISEHSARAGAQANLQSQFERTASARADVHSFILHEADVINFISDIEQAGRSLGLAIETQTLDIVEKDELYNVLNISMQFEGGDVRATHFLELLETLPYASSVQTYTYSVAEEGSSSVVGSVSLFAYLHTK